MKSLFATIRGQKLVVLGRRTISNDIIFKAMTVMVFSTVFITFGVIVLTITDPQFDVLKIVFEEVSAFCTVGLSTGITSQFSTPGKVVLILSMFVGRVGVLTMAFALSSTVKSNAFKYPDTHIMIG
jgi:Trk-type K+ transport system membrane component